MRRAEELGFDCRCPTLVVPRNIASRYPTPSPERGPARPRANASSSSRLWPGSRRSPAGRLITAVAVIPYRAAMHTAKIAAPSTCSPRAPGAGRRRRLDEGGVRSGRRAVRGARPRHRRVPAGLQNPVDRGRPAFRGRHVRFAEITFLPKPVQKPHPPIWVGGESPRCAAPCATATSGSRSATTRTIGSTRSRFKAGVETPSGGGAEQPRSQDHRARVLRRLVRRTKPAARGRRAPHHDRQPAQVAEDIAALASSA